MERGDLHPVHHGQLHDRKTERELNMIGWNPERVIFAHGHWYRVNGTGKLRRAFG